MTHFLGSHLNRLDAKGRVSVPAAFRTALRAYGTATEGSVSMILRPSHKYPCVEAWPQAVFDKLAQQLDRYELFSPEYDNLAAAIYADAYPIESDKEGRISLNDMLVGHANISDSVTFVGSGPIFQIWEPEAAKARAAEARQIVASSGLTLGGSARAAAAPVGGA